MEIKPTHPVPNNEYPTISIVNYPPTPKAMGWASRFYAPYYKCR